MVRHQSTGRRARRAAAVLAVLAGCAAALAGLVVLFSTTESPTEGPVGVVLVLGLLALPVVLAAVLDRPNQAGELAGQALAMHRDTGHRLGQADALLALGHALQRTEGVTAALPCWRQAYSLFAEIGSPDTDRIQTLLHTSAPPA
jgi:hypothetical protein